MTDLTGAGGGHARCRRGRASSPRWAGWWDPAGPMAPLHRLNPVRIAYIRDQACRRFGRDPERPRPLGGLSRPRRRLRRRHRDRAPGAAGRRGHRHRPDARHRRGGAPARGGGRARDRLRSSTLEAVADRGDRFDLVAGARGGRARGGARPSSPLGRGDRAGRPRRPRHAQPHGGELPLRHRRRRVPARAGCRAAPTAGARS